MTPRWPAPAYRVYLTLGASSAFFFSTYSTLSAIYRIQEAGLDPLQLVLVGTAFELSTFLFEVPTGVVADTISRRRSVIIGVLVMGVAFVLEGALPIFAVILAAHVILGLGYTFTSGAVEAWIADELDDHTATARAFLRSTQVGQLAALGGMGASVALASVALGLPLIVGGLGHLAIGVYLLLVMPERNFRPMQGASWRALAATTQAGVRLVRGQRVMLAIFGSTFFLGAFSETFDRLWEAHLLANFQFPAAPAWSQLVWFGVIQAGALLLSAAATELVRRRFDAASARRVPQVLIGIVSVLMLSVVALGLAGSFVMAVACYQAAVLLRIVHAPLLKAWLNERIESSVRATVFSMESQCDAIGQIAGGPALGWMAAAVSLCAAFVVAGLLIMPAVVLYAWGARRSADRR